MAQFPAWNIEAARELILRLRDREGAALPMLHALQDTFGYVDREALPLIAETLNLSKAEVYGTLTFYHEFRDHPPAGRVIKLCRAEACQSVGCEDVVADLERRYGTRLDGHTQVGKAMVETVYCLGNCALGPAALVDGELVARVDGERLAALCEGGELDRRPVRDEVPA